MKIVLALCVFMFCFTWAFMFCFTWAAIEFSHDAVKHRELDVQIEIARAMAKFGKPNLELRPGTDDESGSQENRRGNCEQSFDRTSE
jgi:hypothetical protein